MALVGIKKNPYIKYEVAQGSGDVSYLQLQPFLPGHGGHLGYQRLEFGTNPPEQPTPAGDEGLGSRSARQRLQHEAAR